MLTFEPGAIDAGAHRFAIGTAGSAMLVLQTVLPALLTANRGSELRLEGGTHNPRAPTFECLARAYLPLLGRMGPQVAIELERPGFEPAGGGVVHVRIQPAPRLEPLHLETRGALLCVAAEVLLSKLPAHIAEREATALANELDIRADSVRVRSIDDSPGPGNVVTVLVESQQITEVFAEFGRRGVPAERVAEHAARAAKRYLASDAPVGVHLADQLLLPLALAGGGSFVTLPPSSHTRTNIDVIQAFLPVAIRCAALDETEKWKIEVTQRAT
jgi:RNA 3'-terminal phosphate cyclase (ATP)